jgi:hypothetical protein
MAMTAYFEETITDKRNGITVDLAFGRSSAIGENLISLKIWDDTFILDEETGRRLARAMYELAFYLGYARDFDKDDFAGPAGD